METTRSGDAVFPMEFTFVVESERELADLYCRLGMLEVESLEREFSPLIGRCERPTFTESEDLFDEVDQALRERLTELL